MKLDLSMVANEFDMISSDTHVFYNSETGEFDFYNEYMEMEDGDPEKFDDDVWIAAPSQWDINEYRMMEHFVGTITDPRKNEMLSVAIEGRGAFRRFKDTLYRVDLVDEWYSFRQDAFIDVAREWCEENGLDYVETKRRGHEDDTDTPGRDPNTLETERLILRPFTFEDFAAIQSWAGNPANTRYMAWGPNTKEQTLEFLSSTKPGKDFAIVLKDGNVVIGSCGIFPNDGNDTAEMGWILHLDHWKCGYGTEVCGELLRYGFEDLKLRRICTPCAADNYGSCRVMERNGMRREALHKQAFWARVDKKWIDEAEYALLADEYIRK
ncbi:MAG: GNAT family N-acetyltransferase [Propionibacteriaceae bacterium]|nr:GNAT family N-acetyltransferase [Propionibacteriaceae bacterium]